MCPSMLCIQRCMHVLQRLLWAQDAGGCQGHPTSDTHAAWSQVLEGVVGNLTGWSTADTQTSFLPRADGGR